MSHRSDKKVVRVNGYERGCKVRNTVAAVIRRFAPLLLPRWRSENVELMVRSAGNGSIQLVMVDPPGWEWDHRTTESTRELEILDSCDISHLIFRYHDLYLLRPQVEVVLSTIESQVVVQANEVLNSLHQGLRLSDIPLQTLYPLAE